ncbi:hypothetical protein R1sor_012943 [Riccia sorocarpa]|uniref:Uncharacterized protein n=1 Tax=Riccia sorocarpa TaxID=122646 RepID=A0ABD3I554_9MARC
MVSGISCTTLEELPVDPDSPSRPSHSIADSTGLPPPASRVSASSAAYAMANGDFSGIGSQSPGNVGFFGSPRSSKGRRPFQSEQSSGGSGQPTATGNGPAGFSGGAGYSSIKVDR